MTHDRPAAPGGRPAGRQKLGFEDRTLLDGLVLVAGVVFGGGVILLALFGVYPFRGVVAAYLLGYLLEAAGHGLLVSLLVAAVIEVRRPKWTFLGTVGHLVIGLGTVALLAGVVLLDRWVVHVGLGTKATVGYFVLAVVGAVSAGVLTYLVMRPDGFDGWAQDLGIHLIAGMAGTAAGAFLAALLIAGWAQQRQANLPDATIGIPVVHGITGSYVALGDSYSAGEGLEPFDATTGSLSTGGNKCHRSVKSAYPRLFTFDTPTPRETQACSGAVTSDVYDKLPLGGPVGSVGPQVDDAVHADVGLVTITVGGDDALFSTIVRRCFTNSNCITKRFASPPVDTARRPKITFPPPQPLDTWGPAEVQVVGERVATLYSSLRTSYPNARIVAIGYPYLFPADRAGFKPNDCASILRRFSLTERLRIRALTDQLNNALYERAVGAKVEFVSPVAVWEGHEPCGSEGQFVNSIKPILNVTNPGVDGGSFHPTKEGQRQLAALVACYLNLNFKAPNPFVGGVARPVAVNGIMAPSALGLVDAPGSAPDLVACARAK